MKEKKTQIAARVPKEISEKVKTLGEHFGWGGKQEVVERALKHYVDMTEGNIEEVPIAREDRVLLSLKDIKEKVLAGCTVTATNITPFSPPVLERLGDIVAEYMEKENPERIWATDEESYERNEALEISRDEVPQEARKGKQIRALWGVKEVEGLIVARKELVLNPTMIKVMD